MKLLNIRVNGKKLNQEKLEQLARDLENSLNAVGFITYVRVKNGSRIDISQGGRCFSVCVKRLGYNAQVPYSNSFSFMIDTCGIKGYKRTNVPTWSQRVEFNNIINNELDRWEVSSNIKSGFFIIREGKISFDETDWENQIPNDSHDYCMNRIVELDPYLENEGERRLKEHRKANKKAPLEKAIGKMGAA